MSLDSMTECVPAMKHRVSKSFLGDAFTFGDNINDNDNMILSI